MIRFKPPLTRAQLKAKVDAHDADWSARAVTRRDAFLAAGRFVEEQSIWSDVKDVFMALQFNKCIFCERVLGGKQAGKAEHDVEHFRPKGRVMKWPADRARKDRERKYAFETGEPSVIGYYWLAYDIENYACACKACNSNRKRDYFPITGKRGDVGKSIAALNRSEKPLLLFPHGEHGDDPECFITFVGPLAVAVPAHGVGRQRALVTIDFFALNEREELLQDRARAIRDLFKAIRLSQSDPDPQIRESAARDIEINTSDAAPQAACARAYLELVKADPQKAWEIYSSITLYNGDLTASASGTWPRAREAR